MWLVQQIQSIEKQDRRLPARIEELNCCFQHSQIDNWDSNLNCAGGEYISYRAFGSYYSPLKFKLL